MRYDVNEYLYADNSIKKEFQIEVYSGDNYETTITNDNIYQEKIEISRSLCSEDQLVFGACEAATMKFTVRSSVGTLINKRLKVYISLNETTPFMVGEFYVKTDTLSGDRASREITAKDKLYDIINSDVSEWYSRTSFPITLRDFRDSFFTHFGLTQRTISLPNDSYVVTETVIADVLTGLDVVNAICSANGCFGLVDGEGYFNYVFLNSPSTKNYGKNYKIDSFEYEDYTVQSITGLKVHTNKTIITIGTDVNQYVMTDNFLFYDRLETDIQPYIENIFDVISHTVNFTPLKVDTYGDFCVEVGDIVTFTTSNNQIISTVVLNKTTKGLQSLTDSFVTESPEYLQYDLNSTNSQIIRLWNNTIVLQENIENAKTVVYAYRNRDAYEGADSITDTEKTIISMQVTANRDSIPIFVATVPLTMSLDGEVTFTYYINGVQIESDADVIYLTKGEQFVTLSTFFQLSAGATITFSVTAKAEYRQSVEREQTAKIISLKDWIDNQSITVDVQNETATFDYAYVDTPIDETPPVATIAAFAIRAAIFASGLEDKQGSGTDVTLADTEILFNIIEIGFDSVFDSVTSDKKTPIGGTITETETEITLVTIGMDIVSDSVNVRVFGESKVLLAENDDNLITEDGDFYYTEGV